MKHATGPLVSIVTPLYNEAAHLPECIHSVLAQTYDNWDYTIVNNRSTDESGKIARELAAKDHRIRVIDNQEFLRAYPNHNEALRHISKDSKYCKIVFADDWMFPECIERMVAVAEENPSTGIVGAYVLEGTRVTCTGLPYPSPKISGRELCRRHFVEGLHTFGSANSVLYRSELVRKRDPFFVDSDIHADTEACFALMQVSDFGFVHQVLTFTRVRPESLTAVANDLHTYYASMLRHLQEYGPWCLTPKEFEACMSEHMSGYYRFLGTSVLLGRDATFWKFHKSRLRDAGVGFSSARVAWEALAATARAAMHPRTYLAKMFARKKQPDIRLSSRFSIHQGEIR